jgi:hypothetical protein
MGNFTQAIWRLSTMTEERLRHFEQQITQREGSRLLEELDTERALQGVVEHPEHISSQVILPPQAGLS